MQNDNVEYEYVPQPYPQVPQGMQRADNRLGDFVDKIAPDVAVEKFRRKLMGEEFVDGHWVKIASLQKDAISEKGAWDIANLMSSSGGSINMTISKLNENQIRERIRYLIKELLITCIANWSAEDYNLSNSAKLYQIKSMVLGNAVGGMNQAGGGSIQELFKTTVQENRMISSEKKEPNKLARLFGFGGSGDSK